MTELKSVTFRQDCPYAKRCELQYPYCETCCSECKFSALLDERNKPGETMARQIYRKMEIGKEYTTSELYDLVSEMYPATGEDMRRVTAKEMWKVVNTGYATTRTEEATLGSVRGCQFGGTKTVYKTYTMRYWRRVK